MNYSEIDKQAGQQKEYRSLGSSSFTFTRRNNKLVGCFLRVDRVSSKTGENEFGVYHFDTDMGIVKFLSGGYADREIFSNMQIGGIYRIIYHGKKRIGKHRKMHDYSVTVLRDPDIDTESIPTASELP